MGHEGSEYQQLYTYCKNSQIHDAPYGKEIANSILENFQTLFDDVVDDECAVDDSAAENEVVIAVDVLDQLDRSKPGFRFSNHYDSSYNKTKKIVTLKVQGHPLVVIKVEAINNLL